MFDLFFVLRSVTHGQRGRDLLTAAGIRCRLLRAPRAIAPSGCAYALCVDRADAAAAASALFAGGLSYTGPFLRLQNGDYREIRP